MGVSPKWIRRQIKAGVIDPARSGNKRNSRFALSDADIDVLRTVLDAGGGAGSRGELARIAELESDRAELLAQVAWTRAVAQEQQKAPEAERGRSERLEAELQVQRTRIEQLKALSALHRLLGRHKAI